VSAIAKQNDRQGHRVAAAFNADFFDVPTGVPLGLQITAGELVTTPAGSSSTFLAVMPDRTVRIGRTAQVEVYIRTQSGARFELNGVNKLLKKNSANTALLMTDKFGGSTLSENAVITITIAPKEQDAKVQPGKVLSGVVESMEAGDNKPIPAGNWLLTANGTKAEWLRQNIKVGETISLYVSIGNDLNGALYAVGGFNHRFADVLLHKGEVPKELLDLADKNNFERHPRTIFATKGNELHVFVVDGRQEGYSDGISVMDAAGYLQGLGMEEAINVDGGGSSTYVLRKPGDSSLTLLNRPSDGKEREIGNALLIVSTGSEK
jgi:exopolysaccharide biosynthesis protein